MSTNISGELEAFREQWRQEVSSRARAVTHRKEEKHSTTVTRPEDGLLVPEIYSTAQKQQNTIDPNVLSTPANDLREPTILEETTICRDAKEPDSALEHYERAVERENQGNLGDSLNHYRKAYRLDADVHRAYKLKHYPPTDIPNRRRSDVPNIEPAILHSNAQISDPSCSDLLATFACASIQGVSAPVEGSPLPPCPISTLPSEIISELLRRIALLDPATLARLGMICKRFAFLVTHEDHLWKTICESEDKGFRGMHYRWACTIPGGQIPVSIEELDARMAQVTTTYSPMLLTSKYPSYRQMYHQRPRIRYNGCYISTVNYIRPGASTSSQVTFTSPVLIVTYYRYLRFFRDGTCVSLLTTNEPADVIHQLTKANVHTKHPAGLPSVVMNNALRGRWRLSGDPHDDSNDEEEGILFIETDGVDAGKPQAKYMYQMTFQMRSVSRTSAATRNNKLSWLSFRSYNKLTDDWADFGLKNDRAFFWSRVKSYNNGE